MSYYAQFDDEAKTGGDVATISGWGQFIRWADSFDSDELRHLAHYGWSQELDALGKEIDAAIEVGGDGDAIDVARGIRGLIESADGAQVLVITLGESGPDDNADLAVKSTSPVPLPSDEEADAEG